MLAIIYSGVEEQRLAAAVDENVVFSQWHAQLAGHAALSMMVGRLDTLLEAWGNEEAMEEQKTRGSGVNTNEARVCFCTAICDDLTLSPLLSCVPC